MKHTCLALVLIFPLWSFAADSGWISLFDGESFDGWKANENVGTWVIEDGGLVSRGKRSHLFYVGDVADAKFQNFEFIAEVMTEPGSNSGIYIHTAWQPEGWPTQGYECQVINSSLQPAGKYSERKLTGSIYAVRNNWIAPVQDGEWFRYRILVSGSTIRTFINDKLVSDYTENSEDWRAESKQGRWLGRGTFALQGHDPQSVVRFRKLHVRLLPADSPTRGDRVTDRELSALIGRCSDRNLPLIDVGVPDTADNHAAARLHGVSLANLHQMDSPLPGLVINDREVSPSVQQIMTAAAAGQSIAFSSGGAHLSPQRLKVRLQAMSDAGLKWDDLWTPAP